MQYFPEEEMLQSVKRRRRGGGGSGGGGAKQCCPPHGPAFHNSRCLRCGKEVPDDDRRTVVRLDSVLEGLAIESRFLDQWKRRDLGAVRRGGKLILVLDLDNTLLHSQAFKDLGSKPVDDPECELHVFEALEVATKLRPFAREFLRAASAMYDMRIYTMGSRMYAEAMAELLDPEGEYFFCAGNRRILSRANCTLKRTKGLDVVLGHPSAVVVLDDTPGVWAEGDRGNVVHVRKYLWDPDGDDGCRESILRKMLGLLKRIHADYFGEPGRDVREIVRSARREILRGCRLLFAGGIPPELSMGRGRVRRWDVVAEEMGATTTSAASSSAVATDATHVVCRREDAAAENVGAVDVGWLEEAYFTWERPPDGRMTLAATS